MVIAALWAAYSLGIIYLFTQSMSLAGCSCMDRPHTEPPIDWIAPTIGLAMVGFRTTAVIVGNADYLIDAYSKYAASTPGGCLSS